MDYTNKSTQPQPNGFTTKEMLIMILEGLVEAGKF